MKEEMTCKTCRSWKKEQAELEYRRNYGICTCHLHKFNTNNGMDICVLDRENNNPKGLHTHEFESEQNYCNIDRSRYCLVTYEDYGCINYNKK